MHIIYHIPGRKIGLTRNLERRKRAYKRLEGVVPEIEVMLVLHDKTNQEAGDLETLWNRRFGYRGQHIHYVHSMEAAQALGSYVTMPPEQRAEFGYRGGQRAAELGVGIHGLSPEQRLENSRNGARKAMEVITYEQRAEWGRQGGPIGGRRSAEALTPEQRSERSRKAGRRVTELGIGIHAQTHEQFVELGFKLAQWNAKNLAPEQRSEWNRKAGLRVAELGVGVCGLTYEQRVEIGRTKAGCSRRGRCPHCGYESNIPTLHRLHFDKCKHKKTIRWLVTRPPQGICRPQPVAKPKIRLPITRPGLPIKWLITRPVLVGRPDNVEGW